MNQHSTMTAPTVSRRRRALGALAALGIALVAVAAVEAASGKNGYAVNALIDEIDADAVTVQTAVAFNKGLAAGANGEVYVVAGSTDFSLNPVYAWNELLAFDVDAGAASGLRRILSLRSYDALIRGISVITAETTDGSGATVLAEGNLLLLVDGYDHVAAVSFRELWMIDPAVQDPTPTVLYHKSPEPAAALGGYSGMVHFALATDGTAYVHTERAGTGSPDGSILALEWSDAVDSYVEASSAVTTEGTVTGGIVVGPDGYLYSFERTESPTSDSTDRVIRIDPTSTDSWTTYSTFSNKFGARPGRFLRLVFNSDGELFLRSAYTHKGRTLHVVLPAPANGEVSKGTQILESNDSLFYSELAAGPAGEIYVVEEVDGVDTILQAAPDGGSGGGGSGGGGNGGGNGGGKGKPK